MKVARSNPQSGQAMVEFALVIFFIFILFVATVQIVLTMHAYNTMADAAKEGVRYAIVHGTQNTSCVGPSTSTTCTTTSSTPYDPVRQQVVNFAALSFQSVTLNDVTVTYFPKSSASGAPACSDPGCMVQVSVSHAYSPLFGLGWPSFTLTATAQGRIVN